MTQTGGTWTVQRLLEWTTPFFTRREVDSPRLSAELLLSHVLNIPRIKLYTDYQRVMPDADLARFRELVRRAAEQEPVEYLTNRAHFFNLEFEVTRDVLIPRPDTETLVENVMQLVRHQPGMESPRVLDLCTGSGCVAAAIAHHIKGANVIATDISQPAVEVARRNIDRLGLKDRVTVEQGDLYAPLANMVDRQPFHMIVANPPYIPTSQIDELDRSVKDYEPTQALDGGLDGLTLHRRILEHAADRLLANGHIFLEIAFNQGEAAMEMAGHFPSLTGFKILKDHAGKDRVLAGRKA